MDFSPAHTQYKWALVAGLFMVLLAIAVVPIWLVRVPPLVDYPNHLARMHILSSRNQSIFLQQYYEIRWAILPNLGMDLVVPPLVSLVPVEKAGRVFLSLIFCLLASGVVALHRVVHDRWSLWPLLAMLFLYNSVFLWGFLNYLFGLGLSLWVFAAWLAWRNQPPVRLIPIFSVFASALFFSHLFALGVYAIAVGAYELGQSWKMRRHSRERVFPQMTTALAQFVLPCVLLVFSPLFDSNPDHVPSWLKDAPHPHQIEFSGVATILDAFKATLRTENILTNRVTSLALVALLLFGTITGRLTIASSLSWTMGALAITTFLMPSNIGTGSYAEIRLPLALILYSMASIDLHLTNRRWITAIAVVFAGILLLRTSVIAEHWLIADRQYDEFLHALDVLPAGSRIFSAIRKNDFSNEVQFRMPSPIPMENLVCWAVITKSAFVSIIFSAPNQQPLMLASPYSSYFSTGEYLVRNRVEWETVDRQYQYLLVRRRDVFRPPIPTTFMPIFTGTHFVIYRLSGAVT